jgi:alkylation response protein AidB-like acyl-CoA dehydrogenase
MPHIYGLGPSGDAWAAAAAVLGRETAAKYASEVDSKARFPEETIGALRKGGFFGLCLPAEHGGKGEGPRTFAAVVEEIAAHCGSSAMIYVMHVSAAQAIASSATLAGKDALLKEIAAGRHLTTLALSEKGSRSQFWMPASVLTPDGNGGFVTTGTKSWVTSANCADSLVASAQKPGAVSPLESTLYLARKGARGLGRLSVPKEDLITAPGEGPKTILEVILPWFTFGTAAMANGLSRASVAATAGHLTGTRFELTGQGLRDLPGLRSRLARMSLMTEQARAMLARAFGEVEAASPTAPLAVLQARLSAIEAAVEVTDLGMKACGGAAFSKHLPVERLFRDARAGWVMAPTVDHLEDFIGKALTGLPLFG